jgi:glycosyltransferase involved in cell wall biosynthesis/SAM-dependent methyltransferase
VLTVRSKLRRIAHAGWRRARPSPPADWWRETPWEAIRAVGLFDAAWYATAYPDIVDAGVDPLWHYAMHGARQGRDPNAMFSTSWYLTTYPDVADEGLNPLLHYFEHGAAEGRDPSPRFDTDWYLAMNADVRAARLNPLAHYLVDGQREGRRPRAVPGRVAGDSSVRVLIVSGEPGTPGHRYRVVRLADAVGRLGGRASVVSLADASLPRLADLDDADVVVLWRTSWGPELTRVVARARQAGAVVVFDVDDLMVDPSLAVVDVVDGIRSQGLTEEDAQYWFGTMHRAASESAACTCPTPELGRRLRELGVPSYVLPNGFDDDAVVRSRLAVRMRTSATSDGVCRIGYATGSLTHQRDFAMMAEPLAEVLRERPAARLVLYRHTLRLEEFPAFDGLHDRVEWRNVVPLEELPFELARFDINLAPLEVGNAFCEAKSALKFFEAALVDVPTVASPTEPLRSAIVDGVTGFLAGDALQWRTVLAKLADDAELRRVVGREAGRSVVWRFGTLRRLQTVKSVLDQLLDPGIAGSEAFALETIRARQPETASPVLADTRVVAVHDRLRESRVTVMVPVHDYAGVVVEALESVRAQTLENLDLVVVDDASSDESLSVVSAWVDANAARFNRVLVLCNTGNIGLAGTRNAGFDAAETPFVLPLDADNLLLPECCDHLLAVLQGSAAAFAYPRIPHFGEASELYPDDIVRGYLPYVPQRLVGSNYIDAMAMVRKDAWFAAGGYRDGLHGWEDYDLWCRFAELGLPGVHLAEDLALYRAHGDSMLHTVTHQGDRIAEVHDAITTKHPWLELDKTQVPGGTDPQSQPDPPALREVSPVRPAPSPRTDAEGGRSLSDRCRRILEHLRCPETGEPLEELPDGGLRSVATHRQWPVVDGRPVLFAGRPAPVIFPSEHRGNPLPPRARSLIAETNGMVLHLSGGGTVAGGEHVIDLDGALFATTDAVGDAHQLPFPPGCFDLVVAMNAFEHYHDPARVIDQLRRVLAPGGLVFVHTAFLQPVHEAPEHYFNATRHGVEHWFSAFETVDLRVSDNFHPGYTLSWIAAEAEDALATDVSAEAADTFAGTTIETFAEFWRDPATRDDDRWHAFTRLTPSTRERLAAGFEYLGRRAD